MDSFTKNNLRCDWALAGKVLVAVLFALLLFWWWSRDAQAASDQTHPRIFFETCDVQFRLSARRNKPIANELVSITNAQCANDLGVLPCTGITDEQGNVEFSMIKNFREDYFLAFIALEGRMAQERLRYVRCSGPRRRVPFRDVTLLKDDVRFIHRGELRGEPKAALLFVHGLRIDIAPGCGYGGGAVTWSSAFGIFSHSGFQTYDFQYPTDQRARDVCRGVMRSTRKIHRRTGLPVGIVAHSFGGVVARECLARFPRIAERSISSLITLGTPHCGVSEFCQAFVCSDADEDIDIDSPDLQWRIHRPVPENIPLTFVAGENPLTGVACESTAISDNIVTVDSALSMCGLDTGAELVVLDGVAHTTLSAMTLAIAPQTQAVFDHLRPIYCAGVEEIDWNFRDDDCDGMIDEDSDGVGEF